MSEYNPPLEDMRFVLEKVVGLDDLPEHPDLGKLNLEMIDSGADTGRKISE